MYYIIVSLILLGIILMLVEIFLTPGIGVAGILSLCALVSSCWYAFHNAGTVPGIIVTALVTVLTAFAIIFAFSKKTWKKMELKESIDTNINSGTPEIKVGDRGEAATRLAPIGSARIGDQGCEVISVNNAMIDAGTPVEVVRIEENKIYVKQITD